MLNEILITDNFFPNPDKERNWALSLQYPNSNFSEKSTNNRSEPIHVVDFEKFSSYKNLFYDKFGLRNHDYFKIIGLSYQFNCSNDYYEIHTDTNWDVAGVVYMTPFAPKNSGTAFFSYNDNKFTKEYEVENIYNRAILYPAGVLHEGQNFFGDTLTNSRLNLVFFATIS